MTFFCAEIQYETVTANLQYINWVKLNFKDRNLLPVKDHCYIFNFTTFGAGLDRHQFCATSIYFLFFTIDIIHLYSDGTVCELMLCDFLAGVCV